MTNVVVTSDVKLAVSYGKRSRLEIYRDILHALNKEVWDNPRPRLTKVAIQANLSYDRFQRALGYLRLLGFCEWVDGSYTVTEKGLEYIREYRRINDALSRFGLRL